MTLDMVEFALNQANIRLLRFDGKVPQKERQPVIDKFRGDPSVRVLLLTLSCGAVGYDDSFLLHSLEISLGYERG